MAAATFIRFFLLRGRTSASLTDIEIGAKSQKTLCAAVSDNRQKFERTKKGRSLLRKHANQALVYKNTFCFG
jgi:hypothetical protein